MQEALRAARAITHEESRARALTGLARHLPDRLQVEALAESFPFADRYMIEQIMSIMSNHSQAGFQVLLWREILHTLAQGTRRDLLESLTALVPLIEHLGGQAAIEDLFYALRDVAQWWP